MSISNRPVEARKNIGVAIFGATGSGKTRMARRLAAAWSRVVTADPTGSLNDGEICADYSHFVRRFAEYYPTQRPFRLCAQFTSEDDWARLFGGLWNVFQAKQGAHPGLLLNLDEVDFWSDPNKITPSLEKLLKYGRHVGMSWAVTCRADVETHRAVRMNASQIILFRQGMLSPHMQRQVRSVGGLRRQDGLPELPAVESLRPHDGDGDAVEGEHFITFPDPFDVFWGRWVALAGRGTPD